MNENMSLIDWIINWWRIWWWGVDPRGPDGPDETWPVGNIQESEGAPMEALNIAPKAPTSLKGETPEQAIAHYRRDYVRWNGGGDP